MLTNRLVDVREATEADSARIAEIYNEGIAGQGATFETTFRTSGDIVDSLRVSAGRFPFLVAEVAGQVVGWASVSTYRPRDCYHGIGEFSIYIAHEAQGHGVGTQLLPALVDAAERAGFWKLLSRVFTFNTGSRRLCAACGFREVGIYEKHAKLEGEWLDVVIVERIISANLA